MFVHRLRIPLVVTLVVAAAAPSTGCAVTPRPPVASPDGADVPELSPDDRWWWAVEELTRECMAGHGFPDYAVTPPWAHGSGPRTADEWVDSVSIERRDSARDALLGTAGSVASPSWLATGCYGRALHDVGVD